MTQTSQRKPFAVIENEAQRVFVAQRAACLRDPFPTLAERIQNLDKVERILIDNTDALCSAMNVDYGCRSVNETKYAEIQGCVDTIAYTRQNLGKWMEPQIREPSRSSSLNRVIPQPKGVVGIVSPWNFPIFLAITPLASVLAAGNRCMIKLPTNMGTVSRLLAEKFREQFAEDNIAILPGVRAHDFSSLPFDHLIFTGSANAGRDVMRAAADNLTPVTLELGGKSPTIICDDFDVALAAQRIFSIKSVNAGQMCVAPDYVFIPEGKRDQFVEAAKQVAARIYPDTNSNGYTSVIDQKSYRRLRATLDDAVAKGAKLIPLLTGAAFNDEMKKIPPHLVIDTNDEMTIMNEEVFGPLLPVKTYRHIDEVVAYINDRDRPLGLYIFSNDKTLQESIIYRTNSGGVTINACAMQVGQHDLPFGGIGASGMGHYHGHEGFVEFSKMRPVCVFPEAVGNS